jgi:hypothetical protein
MLRPTASPVQSPPTSSAIRVNGLLAALPPEFEPQHYGAMPVSLPRAQVLMEPGDMSAYVYFPTTSVLSVIASVEPGELPRSCPSAGKA